MSEKRKNAVIGISLAVLLAAVMLCGLAFGSVNLTLRRIFDAISGNDNTAYIILFRLRLPRVLAASLAGIALSAAGFLLQTVTDNDLCAPNIIGVNSGAGLAVMLILCRLPTLWQLQPVAAFIGALGATLVVLFLSSLSSSYEKKSTVVLAGVAVSSVFSAGISFLSIKYPDALSSYAAFSVGGFSDIATGQLAIPAVMTAVCLAASLIIAPRLELLCLGDDGARSLGVPVRAIRLTAIILASAMCAAAVSFAGLLGFVGLIVPHIVRRLTRSGLRLRLVHAALCGAIIVVLSDLAGRTLFAPGELPAGIIMAFIGAPFFICLLIGRRKKHD
ncbi:MAG: FecCD family ABC transporter permease [Eubacteriales bacterium]